MTVGEMAGHVERPENRQDAVRAVARRASGAGQLLALCAAAIVIGVDRDRNLGDHRIHLGQRFPARLPGLATDRFGDFLLAQTILRGQTLQQFFAHFQRKRRPGAEGLRPSRDGGGSVDFRALARDPALANKIGFLGAHAFSSTGRSRATRIRSPRESFKMAALSEVMRTESFVRTSTGPMVARKSVPLAPIM